MTLSQALRPSEQGDRQLIKLGNTDFALERARVQLEFLRLDPHNQRVSHMLKSKNGGVPTDPTDAELQQTIWEMQPVRDLYNSILQNGGLISDPIVRRNGLVVEGNCRTVCLRELHKHAPDDPRWSSLFVQILPDEASDEQLTMLIGELHIAGKIEWRAFEQAEYVWKMNTLYGKTYDFLAAHLRWSRAKVQQKIAAYEETKAFMERYKDADGINRFSHFEEFMKQEELRDRRDDDPEFMSTFREWVQEGRFPDAKDVRKLPAILDDESATEAFKNGGTSSANSVLKKINPSLESSFWKLIDRAVEELEIVPLLEINDLKAGHEQKAAKLRALQAALEALAAQTGITLK